MKSRMSRKGQYWTLDALLSGLLLAAAVLIMMNSHLVERKVEQKSYVSEDLLNVLSTVKLYELNNTFINQELANGNITDLNNTLIEQIGIYWAKNYTDKAGILLGIFINDSIPAGLGVKVDMGSDQLFLKNISTKNDLSTAKRMISGIAQGKPLFGTSASAYLRKISNKRTSSYAYFGGFIGQGNVTNYLFLPEDFNSSRLLSSELKVDTPGTFNLYFNNIQCGGVYTGSSSIISRWDTSSCNSSLKSGMNNITMNFTGQLNSSYVAGGYFKAVFTTDTLNENTSQGYKRYYFPAIDGFINIYDSISAQGEIMNWTMNISYYSEYQTFMTLGNQTINISLGSNTTQNLVYSKTNQFLGYQVPFRVGITNFSNITVLQSGQPTDSVVVTDVSGSMGDDSGVYYQGCSYWYKRLSTSNWRQIDCEYTGSCIASECQATPPFNTSNHTIIANYGQYSKLDIAKQADQLFVEIILNQSLLHGIGLVHYSDDSYQSSAITNIETTLDNAISNYNSNGYTCICCGINRARDMVINSTKKKFIVIMSDGEANRYCSNDHDFTGSEFFDPLHHISTENRSSEWAINMSRLACQNNITVYAIGFGAAMGAYGQSVMRQIACNSSLYYNATNVSLLAQIYRNISNQILLSANFTSQTVSVIGSYNQTRLLPDSYLDIFYEPLQSASEQNRLSIRIETPQFNSCNASIPIPQGIGISDAYVTSYSGPKWTDLVKINNNPAFNLSIFGSNYQIIGDPFTVLIPSNMLVPGEYNNISIRIGDSAMNSSNCSANNTMIYDALINSSTVRTETLSKAEGCKWTIESVAGTFKNITVPATYAGNNTCSYRNSTGPVYDQTDVYDVSVYQLLRQLDYNKEGRILVDLDQNDLEIIVLTTGQIPYMWGPSIISTDVWQ